MININVGEGAINKRIPIEILLLPKNLLKKVIEGYLSGDGYVSKDGKIKCNSISEEFITTYNLAIAKVYNQNSSYHFSIKKEKCIIENRIVNQHNTYESDFKNNEFKYKKAKIIDKIIWLPIKKIEKSNKVERVYNIEVEEDNSYTANNLIVHNCQGFSFAGKQLNFNDYRIIFSTILQETKPKYFILENVVMKKRISRRYKSIFRSRAYYD